MGRTCRQRWRCRETPDAISVSNPFSKALRTKRCSCKECPLRWRDEQKKWRPFLISIFSAPLGARTLDPNIKSVVLYQLS